MLGDTFISCGHTADLSQGNTELPRVKLSKVNSSLVSFYLGQKILIGHTTKTGLKLFQILNKNNYLHLALNCAIIFELCSNKTILTNSEKVC